MTREPNDSKAASSVESDRNRRFWWRLFGFLIVLIGAAVLVHFLAKKESAHASGSASPAMPVVVAKARTGDLSIYLNGLGSAAALYTVTVRTRVDGELLSIPVQEGQMVAAGD